MYYGVVYKITCCETGKSYIGRTKRSLRQRWYDHCQPSSYCRYLKRAIAKYGKESFTIEAIASSWEKENLKALEIALIKQENTVAPGGYNLTGGGEGGEGICEETREKHRVRMLGNKHAVGTVHTDEYRAGCSERGKLQWTPEKKANQSERWKGNTINLGRVPSEEERQQRSHTSKTSEKAIAQRAKLALFNVGKKNALGYRHTQEELDKISEASKRNHLERFGITFNGERLTATGWAKRLGITQTTMSRRIRIWGVEKALTKRSGETRS